MTGFETTRSNPRANRSGCHVGNACSLRNRQVDITRVAQCLVALRKLRVNRLAHRLANELTDECLDHDAVPFFVLPMSERIFATASGTLSLRSSSNHARTSSLLSVDATSRAIALSSAVSAA